MDTAEPDDKTLIARWQSGDATGGTMLISRYEEQVFVHCCHIAGNPDVAKDLAQEVWIKVLTRLDQFRGDAAFTTWAFSIARNLHFNNLRGESRKQNREDVFLKGNFEMVKAVDPQTDQPMFILLQPSPESSLQSDEIQKVKSALLTLGEPCKTLLHLFYIESFNADAIAEIMGRSQRWFFEHKKACLKAMIEILQGK